MALWMVLVLAVWPLVFAASSDQILGDVAQLEERMEALFKRPENKYYNHDGTALTQLEDIQPKTGGKTSAAVSGKAFNGKVVRESYLKSLAGGFSLKGKQGKACSTPIVAVTTTIKPWIECVDKVARHMKVIVVGDTGSPPSGYTTKLTDATKDNIIFLSVAKQKELYPDIDAVLPVRSFARKNMGYVHALLEYNACSVWDFDDDNCIMDDLGFASMVMNPKTVGPGSAPEGTPLWVSADLMTANPYLLYGSPDFIWPRGMPLEESGHREFPKLVAPQENVMAQVDVVQVMQQRHPDVDANWRLLFGSKGNQNAMMTWQMSTVAVAELFGISPWNWVPFNSQATLLSGRVLTLAYLPFTVNGRVSDIWRSYFMQYLMKHFAKNTGLVAFSGRGVDHRRNPHDWMADENAEEQLYAQSGALVAFLDQRPLSREGVGLLEEYVLLMDDLYQRGFIEQDDVKAIVEWVRVLEPFGSGHKLVTREFAAPKTLKNNVTAVVHINWDHRDIIPIWMGLHGHQFVETRFYLPSDAFLCESISTIQPVCHTADPRTLQGFFAYDSMIHAIRSHLWAYEHGTGNLPRTEGFLFLHDDVAWHTDMNLGGPNSYITEATNIKDDWWIAKLPMGRAACKKFFEEFAKDKRPMCLRGRSDEFYVARKDAEKFVFYMAAMRKRMVFLEIAVPTVMAGILGVKERRPVLSFFTGRRRDPKVVAKLFASHPASKYFFMHPTKLGFVDGVRGHLIK